MKWSICGIGVVSIAIRVESFEKGIELSSEREKLDKGYWVFLIFFFFFLLGFVIDLLLFFCLNQIYDLSKDFLIIWICAFLFFIDFSCYLFIRFLGSVCKFFGEGGAKYINLRANIQTSIYFFQRLGWVAWPPSALE